MNEEHNPTKEPEDQPTPDVARLLKMLEAQTAMKRERRAPSAMQSPGFRYGVLIAIVIFAFASLGILEWILSQLEHSSHPHAAAQPVVGVFPQATPKNSPGGSNNFHN